MAGASPNDIRERKKAWRRLAVGAFSLVSRDDRRRFDAILSEKARELVFRSGARKLLGFAPMPDEPDLSAFFRQWLAEGGFLAFPVWLGGNAMVMRRVADLDNDLHPGRGGILEPAATLPETRPEELDLVIAPGRFFSESCQRMGRGSGCYDTLFSRNAVRRVGVAYDFQIFPELPTTPDDMPVELVITPSRLVGSQD